MNLLISIAFLCAAVVSTAASSQPLTPEEMTNPVGMIKASLSPDTRHIAAIIFNGVNHGLILIDTDTLAVKKLSEGKRFSKGYWSYNKAPRDLTWADNDLIAIDYGYDAESIDLQGKRVRILGESILGRVDSGPNAGQLIVMRDEKNDLIARCHARTGECTRFRHPPGHVIQRAFDRQGNLRAVTVVNSALFKDVSTIANWYKAADKEIWTKLAEFSVTDEYWVPVYVPDEPSTLVINSRVGRDTHALFNYDIAQGRQTELLAGHPTQDIVSWGGIDKTAFDYVETSGMLPQQVWFDAAWARMQKQVDALLPGRINVISGDPSRAVLVHSRADVDPGTWYFFDIAKKSLVTVGKMMPEIDPARMRPMEVTSYKASDGLAIPAYLTRPAGTDGPAPMVVLIHGGPVARDHWEWDADVQLLANRGYLVLQPQFRGSSGFGRKFEEAGFGQWGKAMQDDITDGIRHLISQGVADPRRICIVGASYGGYAALWGLVKTPELYRCAISFAGVTDIDAMLSDSDNAGNKVSREMMARRIGDKKMGSQLFDPVSPLKHAARIQVPVLLMHGKDDERVPVSQGKKMRDALEANGKPVTWLAFDEEGHGLHYVRNRIQYYNTMLEFLGKHNPAEPAPITATPTAASSATSP